MILNILNSSNKNKKFFRASPKQKGKKGGGWGEGIFARLLSAEGGLRGKAFPSFFAKGKLRQYGGQAPQKNFQFLLKKKIRGKIKKYKENFFVLFAEFRRAETLAQNLKIRL